MSGKGKCLIYFSDILRPMMHYYNQGMLIDDPDGGAGELLLKYLSKIRDI
jgi:hypothetical protein